MSDQKLRESERRYRETGAVGDETAFLLERVRAGELAQERLELAAYCGHEAAGMAAGAVGSLGESVSLDAWAEGLGQWPDALVQAAFVAAGFSLPVWDGAAISQAPALALSAVQAWRLDPTEARRLAAEQAAEGAYLAAEPYYDAWVDEPVSGMGEAAVAASWAAKASLSTDPAKALSLAIEAIVAACNALSINANRDCTTEMQDRIGTCLIRAALESAG